MSTRPPSGKKGLHILKCFEKHQTAIIHQFHKSYKEKIAGYRFFNNNRVTPTMLINSLQEQCVKNAQDLHLICIQDTTEYNYNHHSGRLSKDERGVVGNNIDRGFFAHVMLCFDASSSLPIGISSVHQWNRAPEESKKKIANAYKKLPIEDKESYRWIEAAETTKSLLGNAKHLTLVSDRESDIYQLWSRIPDDKTDLTIRARTDRKLANSSSTVFALLDGQSTVGSYEIELRNDCRKRRRSRRVNLNVKYAECQIAKPMMSKTTSVKDPDAIALYVVEAREDNQTICHDDTLVHWVLFTTHQVNNFDQALQVIQQYSFRWQIEQFFRITKKQSIDLESSQLENDARLMKLSLFGFAIALKILQLNLARDGMPNDRASICFTTEEIQILDAIAPTFLATTKKQENPHPIHTLAWASWIIARLGGYSGYRSQSPPGPITYYRGLDMFFKIAEGFRLARIVYKE